MEKYLARFSQFTVDVVIIDFETTSTIHRQSFIKNSSSCKESHYIIKSLEDS